MPQAVIKVVNIDESLPGRKTFQVADESGATYRVWNNMRARIMAGATYEVEYKLNNFQGRTYNMIDQIKMLPPNQQGQPQQGSFLGNGQSPLQYPPSAAGSYKPAKGQQIPDAKDMVIFISMVVKSAIQAGKADPTNPIELHAVMEAGRDAYKAFWEQAPAQTAQADPELNDSIPF